jgi:hypothetical protein
MKVLGLYLNRWVLCLWQNGQRSAKLPQSSMGISQLKNLEHGAEPSIMQRAWDPLSDPSTNELIRRGDTMGCFYIKSRSARLTAQKTLGRHAACPEI